MTFKRDSAGSLLNVEMHYGGDFLLQELAGKGPPERREELPAVLRQAFGGPFSSMTYVYDARGRRIERTHQMGSLGGDRTTYRYGDHNDPIEETIEHRNRNAGIDDDGAVVYSSYTATVQHNRFEYRYDVHGNWTERIVSIRTEPDPAFQPSNIERRIITYHAG